MSLSCVIAFVPDVTTSAFGSLADVRRSFDDALSGGASEVSVAQVGPHVLMVSPGSLWDAPVLAEEPEGAVVATLSGDVFEVNTFGEGSRVRQFADGKLAYEEGEPLGVETVFDEIDDPESSHLELLCRLTGITRDDLRDLDWYMLTPRRKKGLARLFKS